MANKKISFELDVDSKPIDVVIDKSLNLKQAFRELTKELNRTKEGTKEFELLSTKLGDVKDGIDKTNAKSRDFFSSLSLLPGPIGQFSNNVDNAIGSLKTFTSFSFSDLKFQLGETINDFKDIAGSIGKATGITKLYTTLNNALATSFVKVGIGEQAAATGARAFSAALTATGIGALVVGLGLLVSALMEYTSSAKKSSEAQKELNDQILKGSQAAAAASSKFLKQEEENELKRTELAGGTEEQLQQIREEYAKKRLDAARRRVKETEGLVGEERSKIVDAATDAEKELENIQLDGQIRRKKKREDDNKKLLEAERQKNEKIKEENQKADQLLLDLQNQNLLSSIDNERKRQDKELEILMVAEEEKVRQLQISEDKKGQIIEQIRLKYQNKQKENDKKRNEEDAKNLKDAEDFLMKLRLDAMTDQNKKQKEEAEKQYKDEIKRLNELHEQKIYDGTQYRIGVFDAEQILRNKLRAIDDESLQKLKDNEKEKVDVKMQTLDQIMLIADKETTIGRAAIVLRAILQAKELAMEIKNTIAFSKLSLARSKAAVAEGTAKTAKVGFPQNIPLLIGYAAQAAAIISAITSAVSSANSVASEAASGGSEGQNLGRNYEKGGMIEGPRHAQGGVIIEAEGGEAIMSRGSVTMFRPLLSMMNQMGGGTSFSPGAIGGSRPDAPLLNTPSISQSPQIIKTYVVSNELTTEAERQAKLKDLSTL